MPGNANPFNCGAQGCHRSFQTYEALLQHDSNAHANPTPTPSQDQAQRVSNAQSTPTPTPSRAQAQQVRNVIECGAPGCRRSFRSADDLRRHGNDVHRTSSTRVPPDSNPYNCGVSGCRRSFRSREALVKHRRDSHRSQQAGNSSHKANYQQNHPASKLKVYQNVVHILDRKISETFKFVQDSALRDRLRDHIKGMEELDDVSSLTNSTQFRECLKELLKEAKCKDNSELRRALQSDQKEILHLLHGVVNSQAMEARVLELKGDEADHFMNLLVSSTWEGPFAGDSNFYRKARSLQRKLHESSGLFPSELYIEGVELQYDGRQVGHGGFADIFKGLWNASPVAIKRLRSHVDHAKAREALFREAFTWEHLNHPRILPFLGLDFDSFPTYLPCIVTPWMENGTILQHIKRNVLPIESIETLLLEITQGLAYLHDKEVVHGDIRGNNILIDECWHVRLADFGLTGFTNETLRTVSSINHAGSARWMAPELHNPERAGLDRFVRTKASDIYALGCTILEIYTGNVPFSDVPEEGAVAMHVTYHSLRPERPPEISIDRWSLMEDCWRQDHLKRSTVALVLKHMEDMNFGVSVEENSDSN